jgi:hypothetical protein
MPLAGVLGWHLNPDPNPDTPVQALWDAISLVRSYFSEWESTPWAQIDTDEMEDSTKKFKAMLRQMPDAIRQGVCLNAFAALQASSPLLRFLPSPAAAPSPRWTVVNNQLIVL